MVEWSCTECHPHCVLDNNLADGEVIPIPHFCPHKIDKNTGQVKRVEWTKVEKKEDNK